MVKIGDKLKSLRSEKKMTQRELAEKLNVSAQAVSRWENDEVEPSLETLGQLATIFEISVDELFGKEPPVRRCEDTSTDDTVSGNNDENSAAKTAEMLRAEVRSVMTEQRPVLGVCVGEQIMFERGMEHGDGTPGLGLIKGDVELLDADVVPHMGWNTVEAPEGSVLLKGVENERFYFVHSFAAMSASPADTSADQLDFGDAEEHVTWCTYGRSRFVAAYERGPLFATQFHPEKSAEAGAQLLRNWVATF